MKAILVTCLMAGVLVLGPAASAVDIATVIVGDPGNAGEWSGGGGSARYDGPGRVCGAVDYEYGIGKYEVTNGQYIEFLNAVASADPHGLFRQGGMDSSSGGGISRQGYSGSFVYTLRDGDVNNLNRPVNFVDWYDTLRFANWLHNGQPTGSQGPGTTEDGAYDMSLGAGVVRKPRATWVLPTEDEWYKAAYYKAGGTNAGYWNYATQSDALPNNAPPLE